jgi:phosphoenolpyruvate---glycerone phosphotransferase subunit DhaL
MELSPNQVRLMMLQVADRIIESEAMLSQADRDLGDGDHGLGMKRGMEAVKDKLADLEPASVEPVFATTGMAMMSSMGGASGALFGTVFRAGAKALTGRPVLDSEGLALFLEGALEGVMKRGGAKVGDKTMIDALSPAAEAARAAVALPLREALKVVADAAESGKEASRAMIAQFGRAKTLGEACIGFPDAGALSVTVILATMRDYANEGC